MAGSEDNTVVTDMDGPPPAPPESNPCVVLLHTREEGFLPRRYSLEKSPTRIGRDPDAEIILQGDSVSRKHACLEKIGDRWWLVDLGSKNGSFLNDRQIDREVLNNGDLFKIGPNILKYLSGADAEARYHEEIYKLTILDVPTQTYNKRYFGEALEREAVRARRYARPLSLVMFDIDFFKRVNDEHGHLAGDYVLRELARLVQGRVRREEVLARYGGEEFVILLPETPLEGANSLAKNLLTRIASHEFTFQGVTIPITVSIGVAELGEHDNNPNDLVAHADEKLYEAKRAGRNRVCS